MVKSYKGVKSGKRCEFVTVGRRAARGGKVEVTKLGSWPKVVCKYYTCVLLKHH